ncbi:Sodium/potassium-transporting ATPase subunit alpha [Diplonema papillatum]|nr:Sodium/potassium-transporting ATPase subunit alpha [Diplonema papillatum]
MPYEPEAPKKQPSQLEKNVLGKGGTTELELKPKNEGAAKAHLADDVKYEQSNQEVSDLHNFTVDAVFAGPVYPLEADRGRHIDLAEGNPNYINMSDVGNSAGLTQETREDLSRIFGPNQLTPPAEDPEWLKFGKQFTGFFSLLLLAGGVLCMVAYAVRQEDTENLFLGIVLFGVVLITSIFTYNQEAASAKMMKKFKAMGETKTRIIVGGVSTEVESTMLVPGDILHVKLGDKIPCDCRVLEALGDFAVVEAALTGEPNAIKKVPRKSDNPDEPALRQKNIIMTGTDIAIGEAWCMAVSTGDQNVMGRNYQMMIKAKEMKDDTPIKQEIDRFVKIISTIAIFLGVLFFIINVSIDGTLSVNAIVFTIGIIVANVPEGLLATVTVSLALTAARMKDVMVLVKNLEAVETLGSTSVICSDKTGTLTMNKMTAVKAFVGHQMLTTHPVETASWSYLPPAGGAGVYEELIQCATFCGSAKFKSPEDQKGPGGIVSQLWEHLPWPEREAVDGDASERAILIFNEQRLQAYDNMGVTGCKGDDYDSAVTTNSFLPVDIKTMQKCLPPKRTWKDGQSWSLSQVKEHASRVQAARLTYGTVDKLPFNSKNKWMAVTTDMRAAPKSDSKFVTWIKGGSDVVFDFCTHTMSGGQVVELSLEDKKNFAEANADLASNGLRVFAFAKVNYESLNHIAHDGPLEDTVHYFAETMFKTDEFKEGETDESGKPVEAGTQKPITVRGRPQIPLVRPDIAKARMEATGDPAYFVPKVVFLGLLALQDPPRPAVPRAVAICRQASIGVVMVTGDQPQTAAAIARDIGIITKTGRTEDDVIVAKLLSEPGKSRADFKTDRERILKSLKSDERDSITAMAVEGTRIATWNPSKMDGNWSRALEFTWKQGLVFARTSPTQKLLIVQHFKIKESEGGPEKIVAVTGDGVNDAQAVTAADIGICMGIAGMDVTKEAADMILMNDNFASIVDGVLEGRLIFDNLKKSIAYTLSSNIPEISPFIVYILLRVPLPLTTVLILCIDLGTDMVPAISLAYESKEKDIMKRAPRTKYDNLVTDRLISFSYFQIGVVQALAGFYCYFVVFHTEGISPADLPMHGQLEGYFLPNGFPFGGFTINEGLVILAKAQTAYWVSIVVVQWADILICKTRRLSLFEQGMKNNQLNFGLFFETALAVFFVYVPGVRTVFGIEKLRFIYWLPALPFSVFIIVYDELRKWLIRNYPGGWLDRKTYW